MERKIIKRLNIYYYGMLALAILVATGVYFMVMKDIVSPLNPLSTAGQVIQYFVIFDVLVTLPVGLYGFKRMCRKLRTVEDETEKMLTYGRYATWRIVVVSNGMVFGIAAFYLLGAYQSMLWMAAIAAIGWYFSKPTERKMELEMNATEDY